MLLIPTFLLLISPINFTIYLLMKNIQNILLPLFFLIHSFGNIFRVLKIFGFILYKKVSFYAFFKRWLPLSKLSFFLIFNKTFSLNIYLWTLAYDLGCFPFDI